MSRPIHFELQAQDPLRAIAFYRTVFGWAFEAVGPGGGYWQITTGEFGPGINGGLLPRRGPAPKGDEPVTAAMLACSVEDIDDIVAKAKKAGGKIAVSKFSVSGTGLVAYLKDTEGNLIGVWQESQV